MRAIKITPNPAEPIEIIAVEPGFRNLARAIGGPCEYIERFRCPLTHAFSLVGVCDEDGLSNGQPDNQRAWPLYPVPGYTLKGTVLVLREEFDPMEGADFADMDEAMAEAARRLVVDLLERVRA